ncbi:MAG: hypothetical protein P8X89_14485 [Reinekea sp.]
MINQYCEIYSLPRWLGLRTKEVKTKLGDAPNLPLADQAKKDIATQMALRLSEIQHKRMAKIDARIERLQQDRNGLKHRHQVARKELMEQQAQRVQTETQLSKSASAKGSAVYGIA